MASREAETKTKQTMKHLKKNMKSQIRSAVNDSERRVKGRGRSLNGLSAENQKVTKSKCLFIFRKFVKLKL